MLVMLEDRLTKIVNEEATDAERAEYRALKELSHKWVEHINSYNNIHSEIEKTN